MDIEQSRTTWRQMSESEALGTEEAETERAEAILQKWWWKEREDCSFEGTAGKTNLWDERNGTNGGQKKTAPREGLKAEEVIIRQEARLFWGRWKQGRPWEGRSRGAGKPGPKTESVALWEGRSMRECPALSTQ